MSWCVAVVWSALTGVVFIDLIRLGFLLIRSFFDYPYTVLKPEHYLPIAGVLLAWGGLTVTIHKALRPDDPPDASGDSSPEQLAAFFRKLFDASDD